MKMTHINLKLTQGNGPETPMSNPNTPIAPLTTLKRRRLLIAGSGAIALNTVMANAQAQALKSPVGPDWVVGVIPNVSARVLVTNYKPWREQMAKEIGADVSVVTSSDFRKFYECMVSKDYALAVAAPNVGRLAQVDHKWVHLATYEPQIIGLLVRLKSSSSSSVSTLRGKKLAMSNPQSLVALRGNQWLVDQGLKSGADYTPHHARNDESLATVLISGDAPFAMMSQGEFRAVKSPLIEQLEVVTEFARVPGFFVMGSPLMDANALQAWRSALLKLTDTELGKQFSALSGVRQIRAPLPSDIDGLDGVLAATRAALAPQ